MNKTQRDKLRNGSKAEFKSPKTGTVYKIRKLSHTEIIRGHVCQILAVTESKSPEKAKDFEGMISQFRYVIENGVIEPRIFYGPEEETPEDALHVSWIPEDESLLHQAVLGLTGFHPEHLEAVKEYLKNASGSEPAISSPADTASPQAS